MGAPCSLPRFPLHSHSPSSSCWWWWRSSGPCRGLFQPALNRARQKGDQAVCLNNLKQLQLAWQLCTADHQGEYPENYSEWIAGVWRNSFHSWCGPSSAPHDTTPKALRLETFGRHGDITDLPVYRCPSDDATARSTHGKGEETARTRSYGLNGNFCGRSQQVQVVLRKENGTFNHSQVFVFVDETEDSIDDGQFLVRPAPDARWVNLPAGRHHQCGVLSFADSHVEIWKWRTPKCFSPNQQYWRIVESPGDLDDVRRLQAASLPVADYVPQMPHKAKPRKPVLFCSARNAFA